MVSVAHHDGAAQTGDAGHRLPRLGPGGCDVAQADKAVDRLPGGVVQHRLQRHQVAVDVGDDCGAHRVSSKSYEATFSGWMRPPDSASRPPLRPVRAASTSAMIETAVSAGVTAPMSSPSGPEMRAISASV